MRAMDYWMDRVKSFYIPGGHRKFGFEYLPKARNNDDCAAKGVAAISDAYFNQFGFWPENYGRYPNDWIEPPGPIDPNPNPIPPTPPCTFWGHLKRLNFKAAIEHLLGKHKEAK